MTQAFETKKMNDIYGEQVLSVFPPQYRDADGTQIPCGANIKKDGSVGIRLYLPDVSSAKICVHVSGKMHVDIALTRTGESVFEGVIPYNEKYEGCQPLELTADNVSCLTGQLKVGWCLNRPMNFVEIPEKDDAYRAPVAQEHRGNIVSAVYDSSVMGGPVRCMVYTPAGYMKSDKDYPVLYLLHGGTENELAWISTYKVAHTADRLIMEGRAIPCLIVMINCMVRFPESGGFVWDAAAGRMLCEDCIPFIEETFRAKRDKWNRAIAGLSMGSYMTNDIGLMHPGLFGYMGQFTGCMYHETDRPDYERPYPGRMEEFSRNPGKFAEEYRVFFRSTTPMEDHFDYFLQDDAICDRAGISGLTAYHRVVYSENTSKCVSWRRGVRDFLQLIFREE